MFALYLADYCNYFICGVNLVSHAHACPLVDRFAFTMCGFIDRSIRTTGLSLRRAQAQAAAK